MNPHLKAQLPAWHHLESEPRPTNNKSKCLIHKHEARTIADLMRISARLRAQNHDPPHQPSNFCNCQDCNHNRNNQCWSPHDCATKALTRINKTFPKLNPLLEDAHHGNLSLTPNRKSRNDLARTENEEVLFDPTITNKNNLAECFCVFTDPERLSKNPAQRRVTQGPN